MRLFIAVELPFSVRQALGNQVGVLRPQLESVRWVAEENLHLTMVFLGDVPGPLLPDLQHAIRSAVAGTSASAVVLEGLGAFPSPQAARVIWAGVSQGAEWIEQIYQTLLKSLTPFAEEKKTGPFHPHVTLGRVRVPRKDKKIADILRSASWSYPDPVPVREITLFESQLSESGPTYRVVERFPLTGA